ncbi:MAG: monooxygenase FAD-binding [Enterovirga sp.]|nr:monooxygenase FAD-binding [Enterovirga sp.]
MTGHRRQPFPYRTPPELRGAPSVRRPVVVIGAGPVGLTCAIDLALHGIPVLVLDDNDVVSVGSRAICWAKRTLEIWDRIGIGDRMVDKGVTWQVGRVFHGQRELYSFDLLPEPGHKMPAFINLQQYYVEEFLVERAGDLADLIDIRWRNEVTDHVQDQDGVTLSIATPDGGYSLRTDWVVAADGARSPTRSRMGLPFDGHVFEERFLIADVRMEAQFTNERLFWFAPPFHEGQSALLHKQPENVYRLDFQLGPEADPVREREPDRVEARVRAVVGDTPFALEWSSVYAFRCARLDRFVHGRVIFAGDSAHVVSPFGARGGNGGIQDADNLAWKLALVIREEARPALLDTYDEERGHAADENISASSRTTNFMTPKTRAERLFRDGVLALAGELPFARGLVNGGRLSVPARLEGMSLQTGPAGTGAGVAPGGACPDAPVQDGGGGASWLLGHLGTEFVLLLFLPPGAGPPELDVAAQLSPSVRVVVVGDGSAEIEGATVLRDPDGLARSRYGAMNGAAYLIRPDTHVAARFDRLDRCALAGALARASARHRQRAVEAVP